MHHGTRPIRRAWLAAALAAGVLAGCNRMEGRVPVKGTVTLDGEPMADVYAHFYASLETKGNGGYAFTDRAGRFTVTTLQARAGMYPGEYVVTLEPLPGWAPRQEPDGNDAAKIPGVYSRRETTPLRVTIAGPQDDLQVRATAAGQ